MGRMPRGMICGAMLWGVGWLAAPEVSAQGVGGGLNSMGTSGVQGAGTGGTGLGVYGFGASGVGASNSGVSGTGGSGVGTSGMNATGIPTSAPALQTMPSGVPLFTPTVPNSAAGLSGVPTSSASAGGIFSNPLAAPLLMNSMMPGMMPGMTAGTTASTSQTGMYYGPTGLGTTQLGLLLLANQQQASGIGSGQMSGTRAGSSPTGQTSPTSLGSKSQRPVTRPGGLAARYFNRPTGRSAYPQRYFNRQTRYFP